MYPAHGLALFPPFPHDNRVFVAMSFDGRFEPRWQHVIGRGISDAGLEPYRIDIPKTSGSIPAEIIRGIAQSRLVFGDVSLLDGQRNGNVMYEIGIAHASRQPEEVLLFRSDREKLLFDVATIRVNEYDPDTKPDEARALVKDAVQSALRDIATVKAVTVERAVSALDVPSIEVLMTISGSGHGKHPKMTTMRDVLSSAQYAQAIARLLELGVLETHLAPLTREMMLRDDQPVVEFLRTCTSYRVTPFGSAVLLSIATSWKLKELGIDLEWESSPPPTP